VAGATSCGSSAGRRRHHQRFQFFGFGQFDRARRSAAVFVDIDPSTFNLDPRKVEASLGLGGSHKIRALLPVHLYGQCADMDALRDLSEEFKLILIEDAAQAIGAKWRDGNAGWLGIAAAFSFYPTKNLAAYADAGLVTTVDALLAERMRRLRNHGSPRRYVHEEVGWNCRMDAIQAAVLRVKLKYADNMERETPRARREVCSFYLPRQYVR
jgi:dTDP-4-amino-4,6-dideoxygalactose transaminase